MGRTVRILSIDGGGIRGIVPALVLAEIENRAGGPIAGMFDLIAGTSTGGILALGLTKPDGAGKPAFSAAELVKLYEQKGQEIFSRSVWHRIRAMGNMAEEKYPSDGIEGVLGDYFGATRLKEALTEVLVMAYEIERRIPFLFRSARARKDAAYDFAMKDVARATSAAPTYFEPLQLPPKAKGDYWALIDGGVYANNPAMCAYVDARTAWPDADDILLVSLGTGVLTRRLPFNEVTGWGLARWAQPILNVVFDGVSSTVDYQLQQLLPSKPDGARYLRFQTRLDEGSDDMDDAGKTNLRVLRLLAESLIRDKKSTIEALVAQLVK